jgi:glycosyltransferase involved in cell wall biosynthesis
VIPCAVDLDVFAPVERAEARRELGWPRVGPCVLFPAARSDRSKIANKRVDVFDAMIDRLRRSRPGVSATSLDGLSRREVALAMNAADVAVITSMCEGAPVVVKEALACRTPVVSVAVGDVSTVVAGLPGCAIVAREPEALAKAVGRALDMGRDPLLRESMVAYGRRPIAERVLQVYRRLLADRFER